MPTVVVVGGVVMDYTFAVKEWPEQNEAVEAVWTKSPGGKGFNEAIACKRLGADVHIISAIGNDADGRSLCSYLDDAQVNREWLHINDTEPTDITAIIMQDQTPGIIGCRKATNTLTSSHVLAARSIIDSADVVLITFDVAKAAIDQTLRLAKQARKRIIMNPTPYSPAIPLSYVEGVEYVITTESVARKWAKTGGRQGEEQRLDASAESIMQHGAKKVIIASPTEGCRLHTPRDEREPGGRATRHFRRFPIPHDDEDPTGAIDAFCAAAAVFLAEHMKPLAPPDLDLVAFASTACALACTVPGIYAALPIRSKVEDHYLGYDASLLEL